MANIQVIPNLIHSVIFFFSERKREKERDEDGERKDDERMTSKRRILVEETWDDIVRERRTATFKWSLRFFFFLSFPLFRFLFLVINTGCCHGLPTLIFCFVYLGGERKSEEEERGRKRKKKKERRIKYHPKWSKECFNSLNNKIQSSSFSIFFLFPLLSSFLYFLSRSVLEEKKKSSSCLRSLSSMFVFIHILIDRERKKETGERKKQKRRKKETEKSSSRLRFFSPLLQIQSMERVRRKIPFI